MQLCNGEMIKQQEPFESNLSESQPPCGRRRKLGQESKRVAWGVKRAGSLALGYELASPAPTGRGGATTAIQVCGFKDQQAVWGVTKWTEVLPSQRMSSVVGGEESLLEQDPSSCWENALQSRIGYFGTPPAETAGKWHAVCPLSLTQSRPSRKELSGCINVTFLSY